MAKKTPDTQKVKSIRLGWVRDLDAADAEDTVSAATLHTFQDDVRVVGVEILVEANLDDTNMNADGEVQAICEASKTGQMYQPGAIGACEIHNIWTGIFMSGGEIRKAIWIPLTGEGYRGMDFDDGESIYLHYYVACNQALDCSFFGAAYIHYVER